MNFPAEPTPDQQAAARLTAWALGELPADSLTEFEGLLESDPDMEIQAAGTREFCQLLESSLTPPSVAPLTLSPAIRQHLEAAASPPAKSKVSLWMPSLAAAACFAVMLGVYSQSRRSPALGDLTAQNGNAQSPSSAAKKQEFLQQLERSQFFLTHGSQSPELTVQGYPRFSMFKTTGPYEVLVASAGADHADDFSVLDRPIYPQDEQSRTYWAYIKDARVTPGSALLLKDQPVGLVVADPTAVPEGTEIFRFSINPDFSAVPENPFRLVVEAPLSTFSIDVDTASYAIARRHLNEGERPPLDSVRLEEMINYFPMDEAPPMDGKPFAVQVETASAPWAAAHRLVRVALKGKLPPREERRPAHLVFLVDTSGSMGQPNKLPLVQQSLRLLLDQLAPHDQVTLVTYAGDSELKLPATPVVERARIAAAIDALTSNGSTNGSGGIMAAYQQARAHFQEGGVNRVILATDGDFNVGLTGAEDLETLISREAKSGVYLSVLAYGSDNLKDKTAELLADKGNGNYAYIDSLSEARRALVSQLQGTLVTIAKDVKIQVEFNPAQVASYRLLGYENRALANKDFNDDTKDAGEIGAGHSVTALYEIVPAGVVLPVETTDPLKYQTVGGPTGAGDTNNLQVSFEKAPLEEVLEKYQELSGRYIIRDVALTAEITITPPTDAHLSKARAAEWIKAALLKQGIRIQEYVPAKDNRPAIDKVVVAGHANSELLTVKLRYQQPEGTDPSQLIEVPVKDSKLPWEQASANFRWTAAVAGYALLLRDSRLAGKLDWDLVRNMATASKGPDPDGFRGEFLQLIEKAASLAPRSK